MWEYLVVRLRTSKPNVTENILNDWGRDGWELVSICWYLAWTTAYLKRLKS